MPYILGLDTGGTYTDGVLVDIETESVVSRAKELTTKYDLRKGIEACIDSLDIDDPAMIRMVALSTTLATNAVVENRGGKTGLIVIGKKECRDFPAEYIEFLDGETDIKGNARVPVSEKQAVEAVGRLKGKVDAIAVSAYASVRNPGHELLVKRIAEEMTGLPVFCAHELSGSLGYSERTTTAVLNASLIGIVNDFITATGESLRKRNINAEIMIVKSDGSLMREDLALKRPIDTILSGPAASAIGAIHLTGAKNALVLDMGGTTIDVADIADGLIQTGDECATVAGWKTRVNAVEISTHGIGGDSLIRVDDKINVGPKKAEPISRTAYYYDNIRTELFDILKDGSLSPSKRETMSRCYCIASGKNIYNGNRTHDSIVDILKERPHSMSFIAGVAGDQAPDMAEIMLDNREINVIDLTPTDILHVLRRYNEWDEAAAKIRCEIIAEANNMELRDFVLKAEEAVYKKIYTACIQAIADFEQRNADMSSDRAAAYLIEKAFGDRKEFLNVNAKLCKPLIAVGAPVRSWMPFIGKKMNTEIIFPENADVANAIGSVFGNVRESVSALIRKEKGQYRFNLYLPSERLSFDSRKEALKEAKKRLLLIVREKSIMAGCTDPHIEINSKKIYTHSFGKNKKRYVETQIVAKAEGRPDSWRS